MCKNKKIDIKRLVENYIALLAKADLPGKKELFVFLHNEPDIVRVVFKVRK